MGLSICPYYICARVYALCLGRMLLGGGGGGGLNRLKGRYIHYINQASARVTLRASASVELPSPQPTNHPRHRPLYWGRNNHSFIYSLAMLSESFDISWAYIILPLYFKLRRYFFYGECTIIYT